MGRDGNMARRQFRSSTLPQVRKFGSSATKSVMLSRAVNTQLLRVYADEVVCLSARLNRRTTEMESIEPESQDLRDAVLVADMLKVIS